MAERETFWFFSEEAIYGTPVVGYVEAETIEDAARQFTTQTNIPSNVTVYAIPAKHLARVERNVTVVHPEDG